MNTKKNSSNDQTQTKQQKLPYTKTPEEIWKDSGVSKYLSRWKPQFRR